MNSKISTYWLSAALVFSLGIAGCKKGPERVTPIHGIGARTGSDIPAQALGPGGIIDDGRIPEGGLPTTPLPLGVWQPGPEQPFRTDTVYFEFDKSVVKASEVPKLEKIANTIKNGYRGKALRVEGHCDERGTEEYNRALGERRALAIREKLVSLGLDYQLVDTISFGEDRPAEPAHNEAAWSKNRRGEFILLEPPASPTASTK